MNLCALPGRGASAGITITSKNSRPPVLGIRAWMFWPVLPSMARWRAMLMSPLQPSARQMEPLAMSLM
jgi:hypothetical protein